MGGELRSRRIERLFRRQETGRVGNNYRAGCDGERFASRRCLHDKGRCERRETPRLATAALAGLNADLMFHAAKQDRSMEGNKMRVVRVGERGEERPGVLVDENTYVDLSSHYPEVDGRFFAELSEGAIGRLVESGEIDRTPLGSERWGPPIPRPQKIICIGLNYADHAAESGMPIPKEPVVFFKAPNTLVGPNDDIFIPRQSTKTDWEVELGVVIGSECRYLESEDDAVAAIAGYVMSNDVSEREFQLERGGQWVKGKSCETFNPCGPWLATADELRDVRNLDMWLDVNGVRKQNGSTSKMIFSPSYLIWYLSQFMVLEPGDLINTGTPPGVGLGKNPQEFLRAGDRVSLGIEGLGAQASMVSAAP